MSNKAIDEKNNCLQKKITGWFILNPSLLENSDYKSLRNYKNKLIFIKKTPDE